MTSVYPVAMLCAVLLALWPSLATAQSLPPGLVRKTLPHLWEGVGTITDTLVSCVATFLTNTPTVAVSVSGVLVVILVVRLVFGRRRKTRFARRGLTQGTPVASTPAPEGRA